MYMHAILCTHTQTALCGAVVLEGGDERDFCLTPALTRSILILLHSYPMSWQTAGGMVRIRIYAVHEICILISRTWLCRASTYTPHFIL